MINPTDLVRGQKSRKQDEREKRKAELGVCRIRKLPEGGKGCRTVGSGSVIRNLLIDWPGYIKDHCCLVTTDKVLPNDNFDLKDYILDFRKLNSTLSEFKLSKFADGVLRFTSGLVVIPLRDPSVFSQTSIFTFRPYSRADVPPSTELFCPIVDDTDTKAFDVKYFTLNLDQEKYVLHDGQGSGSCSKSLREFIGASNRKPHGAVVLHVNDKNVEAVGILCSSDDHQPISPIWLSKENLKPSSAGSPEDVVQQPLVESPEAANNLHSNEQPQHNKEVEVSGMDKEDATALSKRKKSRSISESTSDPGSSSENSTTEQQLVAETHDADCKTSEQQCELLDEEKKASATNNPGTVIKHSYQDLSDEQQEIVHETLTRQIQVYMKHHNITTHDGVGGLIEHIKKTHNLALESVGLSSLVIEVQCPTLESLESLWNDYCSGHLNKVAERYLVTDAIKRKLNLETVKLKTTIEEENYLICKKALMEKSREAVSADFSTEQTEPDQWTDTSSDFPKDEMAAVEKGKDKKLEDLSWMARAEKAKASRGALHKASISGQYETVKMLVESGEDVEQKDEFSLTPLHLACWYGQESVVQLLLEHGANINALDRFQCTPLQKAERRGHQSIKQLLLKNNASPIYQPLSLKSLTQKAFLHVEERSGYNLLQAYVLEGNYSIIHNLSVCLDNFVGEMNLKTTGNDAKLFPGKTAVDILSILAESKRCYADINKGYQEYVKKVNTFTELHWCADRDDSEETVELVLNNSVDVNILSLSICTPLAVWASVTSSSIYIKTLIDLGADVNADDNDKVTPLHAATFFNNYSAIHLLLEHVADVNIQDNNGDAPLHVSTFRGFYEVSKLLIESSRSNINLRNKKGKTPLYIAVQNKREQLIELLIDLGADVNADDNDKVTPLHAAAFFNNYSAIHLLLEHVADVNIQDNNGDTPLHMSTFKGFYEVSKLLIESSRSNINLRNKKGETPLYIAVQNKREQLIELLIESNADVSMGYKEDPGERIYLVRGKDRGKPAWHYVFVEKHLLGLFLKKNERERTRCSRLWNCS